MHRGLCTSRDTMRKALSHAPAWAGTLGATRYAGRARCTACAPKVPDRLVVSNLTKPAAMWLADRCQMSVVVYDYPGYGFSSGDLCTTDANMFTACEAALRFITDILKHPAEDITVLGKSIGTVPAVQLAAQPREIGVYWYSFSNHYRTWHSATALSSFPPSTVARAA